MTDRVSDQRTAEELRASTPLDTERRLRGEGGAGLVGHILGIIANQENRQRGLGAAAADQRARTVEVLLANLAVAAFNRVNPSRFVAVPFRRNAYAPLGLSHDAMVLARAALLGSGMIEYHPGFYRRHHYEDMGYRLVARLRAAKGLLDLFDDFEVGRSTVQHLRERLVKLNRASPDAGPEPAEVTASRAVLDRANARLATCKLEVPDYVWRHLKDTVHPEATDEDELAHLYCGDQTAMSLYRVFTGDWTKGGRLYGGWWMNLPAEDRRLLKIDGEPVVEIDYRHLHPILLYRFLGKPLDRDPYCLPPYSRELCKETFQRLLNRPANRGGANIKRAKDFHPPEGISYPTFIADYKAHLSDVADYLGKGVGLILQRADSELALRVLDLMDKAEAIVLPVHDSFIVQVRHRELLEATMREAFVDMCKVQPDLRTTLPREWDRPEDHN